MKNSYKMGLALLWVWLLTGCSPHAAPRDIVGTWTHPSGARLTIEAKGSFVAKSLPGGNVIWPSKEVAGSDGYGKWTLGTGDKEGILLLAFHNDLPVMKPVPGMRAGFDTQLMVDQDAAGWYLFGWVEEEGGERFIFRKS
jgi:hypothetical protein